MMFIGFPFESMEVGQPRHSLTNSHGFTICGAAASEIPLEIYAGLCQGFKWNSWRDTSGRGEKELMFKGERNM